MSTEHSISARKLSQILAQTRLLPSDCLPHVDSDRFSPEKNLLEFIIEAWNDPRIDSEIAAWLEQQLTAGAHLTLGIPGELGSAFRDWAGLRLAWWPRGCPAGFRVGLASSRLGRQLNTKISWFTVLRAACDKIDPSRDIVVSATSTAAAKYVKRACELFDLRLLQIEFPSPEEGSIEHWIRQIQKFTVEDRSDHVWPLLLSPPLLQPSEDLEQNATIEAAPPRDRALVAISDRLLAFHIRAHGHLDMLVRARLAEDRWSPASVYVAIGSELVSGAAAEGLLDAGAVGWIVTTGSEAASQKKPHKPSSTTTLTSGATSVEAIHNRTALHAWNYLTHCTRCQNGPWPDQTEQDYLDELILKDESGDRSSLATLIRIIRQRRLIATSKTSRGGTPIVSFTAAALNELNRLNVFRPHRGRWDFEPYGICIDRQWLAGRGVRAVQYGNEQLWESMSESDRPFFQVHRTKARGQTAFIDWRVECEWRHLGDVDLSDLPRDAAKIFVPTQSEADQLAEISLWPVFVLPRIEKRPKRKPKPK